MFLGMAAIFAAAGNAAKAFAESTEEGYAAPGSEEQPKRGRGRPPGKPEDPAAAPAGDTGKTDEERLNANKLIIKPLIENNQGEDVKKVIGKYSKTGLKDLPAASQADFEKDIAALTY